MRWDLDEVVAVKPYSTRALNDLGERTLRKWLPSVLCGPQALDYERLVDCILPRHRLNVVPAEAGELVDAHGCVAIEKEPPGSVITILLEEQLYDALFEQNSNTNLARSTLLHEVSHGILHVDQYRAILLANEHSTTGPVLKRERRKDLKPYEDPEWQAWTLAGVLAAPTSTMQMLGEPSPADIADVYGGSESFARKHLSRMRRADLI